MHFRGCGGEPNRLARCYHSGETRDLAWVVEAIGRRFPERPLFAAGVSLGGNVLLKWLGELGPEAPLAGAAAVSVPFDLGRSADRIEQGFSKIYRRYLVRGLHRKIRAKFGTWNESPIDLSKLSRWRTFREFDENVTSPCMDSTGRRTTIARRAAVRSCPDPGPYPHRASGKRSVRARFGRSSAFPVGASGGVCVRRARGFRRRSRPGPPPILAGRTNSRLLRGSADRPVLSIFVARAHVSAAAGRTEGKSACALAKT